MEVLDFHDGRWKALGIWSQDIDIVGLSSYGCRRFRLERKSRLPTCFLVVFSTAESWRHEWISRWTWLWKVGWLHSGVDKQKLTVLVSRFSFLLIGRNHAFSLIFPLGANLPGVLPWSSVLMSSQRQQRISVPSALANKGSDLKDQASIVSSRTSCAREEISQPTTGLVERVFMVGNSRMKTFSSSTLVRGSWVWQTVCSNFWLNGSAFLRFSP